MYFLDFENSLSIQKVLCHWEYVFLNCWSLERMNSLAWLWSYEEMSHCESHECVVFHQFFVALYFNARIEWGHWMHYAVSWCFKILMTSWCQIVFIREYDLLSVKLSRILCFSLLQCQEMMDHLMHSAEKWCFIFVDELMLNCLHVRVWSIKSYK